MQLIHNKKEFHHWFTNEFLFDPKDTANELIDEGEMTRFIEQHQPAEYPCVALMNHTFPLADSPHVIFIYKQQVVDWLKQMS